MIRLSASKAGRWVNCTGSVQLEAKYPSTYKQAAVDGTNAHNLVPLILEDSTISTNVLDPEMSEAVKTYVDVLKKHQEENKVYVEERIEIPASSGVSLTGVPDAYVFDPERLKITVLDFKTGFGVVEPYQNWQLITYALLIIAQYIKYGLLESSNIDCELIIVQPRAHHAAGPVRSWSIPANEVSTYSKKLTHLTNELSAGRFVSKVGVWCRYCRALHACNTAALAAGLAMDTADLPVTYDLTPEQLALELSHTDDALRTLTRRLTALQEVATSKIQSGTIVPGWEVSPGRGSLVWNRPPEEITRAMDVLSVPVRKPEMLITPKQAEAAGVSASVLQHYTCNRQGRLKLKRSDSSDLARRLFGNNERT